MIEEVPQEPVMDIYSEMKIQAMSSANDILKNIVTASQDASKKIAGESLSVYKELVEWDWFEHHPIENQENHWLYVTMIAQTQYRHLKWKHENPKKEKQTLTKWERVVGKASR